MHPSSETRRIRARLEARRRELLARYTDKDELVDIANDRWDERVLAVMSEHDALALENIAAELLHLDNDAT